MIRRVLVTGLTTLVFCAGAGAITFTSAQFDVNAVAVSDGSPGVDAQSGTASAAPLIAVAESIGTSNIATSGAVGALGLLTTSADVSGAGGITNAAGTSHFIGSFMMSAAEPMLNIGFDSHDSASGSGLAASSLFVSFTSRGTTLFQDLVSGPWSFSYNLGPGGVGQLDMTLSSEASAGFPTQGVGNASSFGLVTITSAVPLPAPWLLLLVGLGPVAAAKRRAARAMARAG